MSWLITAFEPFGGANTNSSQIVLEALRTQVSQNGLYSDLITRLHFFNSVPVDFALAWPTLQNEIRRYPNLTGVLALGQAEGRTKISLERVALNWIDAKIPDNQGVQIQQKKIVENSPDVLWSKIPWENLPSSIHWERSYSAGTYLCNALLFQLLQWSGKNKKLAGFIHLPLLTSQNESIFSEKISRVDTQIATESMLKIIEFLDLIRPNFLDT